MKRIKKFLAQFKTFIFFGLVGGLGTIVNTGFLYSFMHYTGLHYLLASILATEMAIIFNFFGNDKFTFRHIESKKSHLKFLRFQIISLTSIIGTASILFLLTHLFGESNILIWNVLAVITMSIANYSLNTRFTWKKNNKKIKETKKEFLKPLFTGYVVKVALLTLITIIFIVSFASAALVSVSQLGYHPDATKQVIVYLPTGNISSFNIYDTQDVLQPGNFNLTVPKTNNQVNVNCQGNLSCLVGNFTNFKQEGQFYILTNNGLRSPNFTISKNIFNSTIDVYFELFNALLQQNSSYHADLNAGYDPIFPAMADGSFIMEADQAALSLIRLGSAYRRNPSLFQFDKYEVSKANTPDAVEYIKVYTDYLSNIQGIVIQETNSGTGFRLNPHVEVTNAFVPGPTNITNMTVYTPNGTSPIFLKVVNVTSLCGENNYSGWQNCIDDAALYYKCQANETCLNMTYQEKLGKVTSHSNGYGVSQGWGYEFGCFNDILFNQEAFINEYNPCMIFYANSSNRAYTSETLLGFTEAIPALYDYNPTEAQKVLTRAINTEAFLLSNYTAYKKGDSDIGYYGAALFLLYDYTNDSNYLVKAYNLAPNISINFEASNTDGDEYYWEEYARHKEALNASNLVYLRNNYDPARYFSDILYGEYSNKGELSMDQTGERVFQIYRNYNFQNSRQILGMGVIAARALNLDNGAPDFTKVIFDNQLAWLTGMNAVQEGVSVGSNLSSYSFILGIGNYPEQFHSRYLVNSGYTSASSNNILGFRNTDKQFIDTEGNLTYFDGFATILGKIFGAQGNGWQNETKLHPNGFIINQNFQNGKSYIPGWITGAFDKNGDTDTDVIFNYEDNLNTYEFTETTNEIGATAIELYAYLDGQYNNKSRYARIILNYSQDNSTIYNGTLSTSTVPTNATIFIAGPSYSQILITPILNLSLKPGNYNLTITKEGYYNTTDSITINQNQSLNKTYNLSQIRNGILQIISTPSNTSITINGSSRGLSPQNITLAEGIYSVVLSLTNHTSNSSMINITFNSTNLHNVTLELAPITNLTGNQSTSLEYINDSPDGAQYETFETETSFYNLSLPYSGPVTWYIDGIYQTTTPDGKNHSISYRPNLLTTDTYTPRKIIIRAVASDVEYTWSVDVYNFFNLFMSSNTGKSGTTVFVHSNNLKDTFQSLQININGVYYSLLPEPAENNETKWTVRVDNTEFLCGANDIQEIKAFSSLTNTTYLETIPAGARSFGKDCSSDDDNSPHNNGGGGGSGVTFKGISLVYLTLSENVISKNDTLNVTLDVHSETSVSKVRATLIGPDGREIILSLEKTKGTSTYGTWAYKMSDLATGSYSVQKITITSTLEEKSFDIKDRAFYVVSETVSMDENLMLVYTSLDKSRVDKISNVTLKLDARDADGINNITATISKTHGGKTTVFSIPLKQISGKSTYGTWEGIFEVNEGDTTYRVTTISLSNSKETAKRSITDRSVYATDALPAPKGTGTNFLTGNVIGNFSDLIKKPFAPTILALLATGVIVAFFFIRKRILINRVSGI